MNKNRLLALPVICIVVAMIGMAVMASSSSKGFSVYDADGDDITSFFDGSTLSGTDLSTVSGLQDKLTAANKDLKVADLKFVVGYDITPNKAFGPDEPFAHKVVIPCDIGENEYAALIHDGVCVAVVKGKLTQATFDGIDGYSPFLVYKATVKTSSQTGEYAAPYIIMISTALVACGAIFAIRAKKATK